MTCGWLEASLWAAGGAFLAVGGLGAWLAIWLERWSRE